MINKRKIDKLLRGECSPEELEKLQQYWQAEDQSEINALLEKHWQEASRGAGTDPGLEQRLWRKIQQARPEGTRRISWHRWLAAASVALLAGLGLYWLSLPSSAPLQTKVVERVNEARAPMRIPLDDGSAVWLKQGSRLKYAQPFDRKTWLSGEGFFEITKNPEQPFIVQAGKVRTRVLGTSFNLKAAEGDSVVQVALVEGSVEVQWETDTAGAVRIVPGEQLTYHRQRQRVESERFLEDAPYAWKNGVIYFQKADVYEVARTLEQWYDITIEIPEDQQLYGQLVHRYDTNKLSLDEVLKGISNVMDYRFERKGSGTLLILSKN